MTVQTTFNKYENDSLVAEKSEQTVLACTIDTAMKGGADKILSAKATVSSLKAVSADGQATVSGKLNVKAIYITPEGALESVDYISDFSKTVSAPSAVEGATVIARSKVIDVQAAIEGDSIRIQTVIEICTYVVVHREYQLLEDVSEAFVRKGECEFSRFVGVTETTCPVDEQYATGALVEKVLEFGCTAHVCKVTPDGAGAIAEGEACATIVYVSDGKAVQKNLTMPFVCRLDVKEGATADVTAEITDCKLVIGGSATENVFEVKADVTLTATVFENYKAELVTDAYCPVRDLKLSHLCSSCEDYCGTSRTRERISGSVEAGTDGTGISRIVCAGEKDNAVATVEIKDDKAYVEGVLAVCVVYITDNEEYKSVDIDLPYSAEIALCGGCDKAEIKVASCDVTAKVKRDCEIEVNATVCISADCRKSREICATDGLEEGDELRPCEDAVSIYYAKQGETLWDIAKKLSMSPEAISVQNPDIGDVLESDGKIVVYREIAV